MAPSRSVLAVLIAAAIPSFAQEAPKADPCPKPPTAEPGKEPALKGEAGKPGEGRGDRSERPDRKDRPEGPWKPDGMPPWGHRGPPPIPLDKEKLPPEAEADRDRAQRELLRLTPEQRQKVWRAVLAVMNLPEDKRDSLINTEEERRNKVREQIEQAIKDIGVPIPDDRKRRFFRTYFEGRRSIEEQLRKEGDERRAALTRELHERLKKDFGPEPTQQTQQQVEPSLQVQPK
jgi:hypothetical protein